MKRAMTVLAGVLFVMIMSANARALPYTWVDTIDFNPDVYIGNWDSYSYTHDLTDNTPWPSTPRLTVFHHTS